MSHIRIIEDDEAIAEIERDYLEVNGFYSINCHRRRIGIESGAERKV